MGIDEVVYVHSAEEIEPLFPIGAVVLELSLEMRMGGKRSGVMLTDGSFIDFVMQGTNAYIDEADAERFRVLRRGHRARAATARTAMSSVVIAVARISLDVERPEKI